MDKGVRRRQLQYLELVEGGELLFVPGIEGFAPELVNSLLHEESGLGVIQHGTYCTISLEISRGELNYGRDQQHAEED